MALITLKVTTTSDENDGGNGGRGLSLRDALLITQGKPQNKYRIQLKSGATYQLTKSGSREQLGKTGDLDLRNSNVSIETYGGNQQATIDASTLADPERVFHVYGGSKLELNNIKVTGGFVENDRGGGLLVADSDVTLKNSTVEGNFANDGGGFYAKDSDITLLETDLVGNAAKQFGGGIFTTGSDLTIEGGRFERNRATSNKGGAIYAIEEGFDEVVLDIKKTTFSGNSSSNGGGAIAGIDGVEMIVHDITFQRNATTGGEGGGAIFVDGQNREQGKLTVTGKSLFQGNTGKDTTLGGGAVYGQQANIDIEGAQFRENNITGRNDSAGGAIFSTAFGQLTVDDSQFTENFVEVDRYGTGEGGALASSNNTNVTITKGYFANNRVSGTAGAVRLNTGSHHISQTTFLKNTARFFGGATSFSGTEKTVVSDSLFQQNTAGSGGALNIVGGTTEWKNKVRFIANTATKEPVSLAKGDGGGGIIRGGTHTFDDVIGDRNSAFQDGGFLHIDGSDKKTNVTIRNSKITRNSARRDGGGTDITARTTNNADQFSTATFDNVLLKGNRVGDSGGGSMVRGGASSTFKNTRFVENVAGTRANFSKGSFGQGGGFYSRGGRVVGKDIAVVSNRAVFGGGGIAASLTKRSGDRTLGIVDLVNAKIFKNESVASSAGGVLAGQGSEVSLTNTQLTENRAAGEGAAILGLDSGFARPEAKVKLFNSSVVGNVANTNKDNVGKSAVFMETGGKPIGYGLESEAAKFESYNSILSNTKNGRGQTVTDYAGTQPVNVRNNLVSNISEIAGWQNKNNLLNVDPKLIKVDDGVYAATHQSPTIDAGALNWLPADSFDIDGDGNRQEKLPIDQLRKPRVNNGKVNIGATEFQGKGGTTPPDNPTEPPTEPPTGGNIIRGTNKRDRLRGTDGADIITGLGDRDTLLGNGGDDQLLGGSGNDRMFGNDGNDFLLGESGKDRLFGNDGTDVLWGGKGNDRLIGGADSDIFVLSQGEGRDRIRDFRLEEDFIALTPKLSLGQLEIRQVKNNTVIKFGRETIAVLDRTSATDLIAAADVTFIELNNV
ncbi:MAG: hypothetical protein AAFZ17_05535 [Cyanobacteria bacterium J06650_10]